MRKLFWVVVFGVGGPAFLVAVLVLMSAIPTKESAPVPKVLAAVEETGSATPVEGSLIISGDARPLIVEKYLKRYGSPLEPHAKAIVEISDKYGLDYRLLPAIAQQESNLCKKIPADSHNCWGFGIYGDKVTRFDDYPQALETVARTLRRDYIDKGLDTPLEIMAKYTPPSVEIGGPWAAAVSGFLEDLE